MRRPLPLLTVALLLLAPNVRAEEGWIEPSTIEESVFSEMDWWDEPAEAEAPAPRWLYPEAAKAAARLMERIGRTTLSVGATAYAFDRIPPELDEIHTAASPVLGPEDRDAVVALARDGTLRLLRSVSAAGAIGDELRARDVEQQGVVLRREIESAQGVVMSVPDPSFLRTGLRLRATVGLTAAEPLAVRYHLTLTEAPTVEAAPSLGGTLEYVRVPGLLAHGTASLVPGQVAAIWRVEADGSGRLVLLSLEGERPPVDPLTDLGEGYVGVLAGHLAGTEERDPVEFAGAGADDDQAAAEPEPGLQDTWDPFAEAIGVHTADASWEAGPHGLRFGIVRPEDRPRLAEHLVRGAILRGTPSRIDVAREGWGRLSFPVSPGTGFRFFSGTVGTTRGHTLVESGCNVCVLAAPWTAWNGAGLKGAGWACVDGTVDVTLIGREILDIERRTYELRRIEPGYRSYARDAFTLPFVRDRILECRCALSPGASVLPGHTSLRFPLDPTVPGGSGVALHVGDQVIDGALPVGGGGCIASDRLPEARALAPIRLRIGGEPFPVRPNEEARFVLMTRYPFVRTWESEGWCGMRARYPIREPHDMGQEGPREGSALSLRVRTKDGRLLLDVAGEVHGTPEDLGTFDPGDGTVSLVRCPRLLLRVRSLPLASGGRVVEGQGLALAIEREDAVGGWGAHQRLTFASPSLGRAILRSGTAAEAWLDAGAEWWAPTTFSTYFSNHRSGHITTAAETWKDGVVMTLGLPRHSRRLELKVRARPTFEPLALKVGVAPPRPETDLQLLALRRWSDARVLHLDPEHRLRFRNPDPSHPYEVSVGTEPAGGDK